MEDKINLLTMPNGKKEHSIEVRENVPKLREEGKSYAEIGKIVHMSGYSAATIARRSKAKGFVRSAPRSGRPKAITDRTDHNILTQIRRNRRLSAVMIAADLKEQGLAQVTPQMVRKRLHEHRLNGRVARKRPYISKQNQKKRLEFANRHISKPRSYWDSALWSDETKKTSFKHLMAE